MQLNFANIKVKKKIVYTIKVKFIVLLNTD